MPGKPSFQEAFHRRWGKLRDPHVRTLAWLLDAPSLLDPEAPQWRGRIATLRPADEATADWLAQLDRAPAALHMALGLQPFTRLGRYAERLLAFYLQWRGCLVAHGVQVRAEQGGRRETIGEFDFLVRADDGALLHWEFATKLYLLESEGAGSHADYFVGPNLADTLGVKVRKIMERQLALSTHPAARDVLPEPVAAAQALVKGWLFYPLQAQPHEDAEGVTPGHCRGFWCARNELEAIEELSRRPCMMLERLSWLAPAKGSADEMLDRATLLHRLDAHFAGSATPVLVAWMAPAGEEMVETERGFVVPSDWRERARQRLVP
jgi:hypothetical protein